MLVTACRWPSSPDNCLHFDLLPKLRNISRTWSIASSDAMILQASWSLLVNFFLRFFLFFTFTRHPWTTKTFCLKCCYSCIASTIRHIVLVLGNCSVVPRKDEQPGNGAAPPVAGHWIVVAQPSLISVGTPALCAEARPTIAEFGFANSIWHQPPSPHHPLTS